jgi:hypothetical protein
MTDDFEQLESVVALSSGRTVGGELGFTYPAVLDAIELCTANEIAVLGSELFEVHPEGYRTQAISPYRVPMDNHTWQEFVQLNNGQAKQFVLQNPAGDDHIYLLTTSSCREFAALKT